MLSSIDTYLHTQIETTLGNLLTNRYIIEELLKEVQPNVREAFIKAYVYDEKRNPAPPEIPIVYTMPQDKQMLRGAIYIGLREGEESHTSIGNQESTYGAPSRGLLSEQSAVKVDQTNGKMYLEVSKPIAEVDSVTGITFSKGELEYKGNRMYFDYNEVLENLEPFTVWYEAESENPARKGEFGVRSGFTTTEYYSILVLSTNMNTVRCLDLLLKAVLIYMRSTAEEHTNNLLQGVKFGQIDEIPVGENAGGGAKAETLYGRETIIKYVTSYSLDVPIENMIKELQINSKFN
ncbi:hypothetical protein Spock_79 [Bacillus phage Spock]|uniref:Uncharacterized protein n=2 Tax=Bequatrovirus spock TaxID=1918008 RepID=A0A1X9SFV1_9CAUD|nr:hypothetical protein Spock_79 [Bacillus phage Spock]AGY48479.1 hypothetical protein Spock_79 [Bacillus phage Spock]ARQ94993.1 hypothetical protein FLAPJACK_79 [Bacillus phage Flapjack]